MCERERGRERERECVNVCVSVCEREAGSDGFSNPATPLPTSYSPNPESRISSGLRYEYLSPELISEPRTSFRITNDFRAHTLYMKLRMVTYEVSQIPAPHALHHSNLNPRPQSQISKPETPLSEPETQDPNLEPCSPNPDPREPQFRISKCGVGCGRAFALGIVQTLLDSPRFDLTECVH